MNEEQSRTVSASAVASRLGSLAMAGVFVLGALALLATAAGFFGRHWWLLDLPSHFRPQLAIALLMAAIVLGLAKSRVAAGLFGLGSAANAALVAPFLLPSPAQDLEGRLKVGLLNLDIFNPTPGMVIEELDREDPDLVVFIEFTPEWASELERWRADYPYGIAAPRASPFGIAMVSRLPITQERTIQIAANAGPAVLARIEVAGRALDVLAFHPFPPLRKNGTALRDRELEAAAELLAGRVAPTLVVGDLNASYWSYALRDLLSRTGLRPAALGEGLHLTWPTDQPLLSIPIDHVLVSEELGVETFGRGSFVGSDHYPVWATLGWKLGVD